MPPRLPRLLPLVLTLLGSQLQLPRPAAAGAGAIDAGQVVGLVNEHRCLHGAPPATWDAPMLADAQAWADTMLRTGVFAHSGTLLGESLAMLVRGQESAFDATASANASVDLWYAEVASYDFATAGPIAGRTFADIGHFTQLVWVQSTRFAIAVASGSAPDSAGSTRAYVVGRFAPPGNYLDQMAQNVLPPSTNADARTCTNPTLASPPPVPAPSIPRPALQSPPIPAIHAPPPRQQNHPPPPHPPPTRQSHADTRNALRSGGGTGSWRHHGSGWANRWRFNSQPGRF